MSFKERLSRMNAAWSTNRQETGGGFNEAFEDGLYGFQLQSLVLKEGSNSGELMALAEHYCTEGSLGGEVYTQFFNLEKANDEGKIWGQVFLAQLLESLGYETPENMEDLEETLAEVSDAAPTYTARVKTNKAGYKNLAIVRVLTENSGGEAAPQKRNGKGQPEAEPAADREEVETEELINDDTPASGTPAEEGSIEEEGQGDLITFCEAWDIKPGASRAETLAAIREYEWKEADLTVDEVNLLRENAVAMKPKPALAPKGVGVSKVAPRPVSKAAAATKVAPKPAPKVAPKFVASGKRR